MDKLAQLAHQLKQADAIIIGAGSGMSNAAGMDFWYEASPLFMKTMKDYYNKYHFRGIFKGFYNRFDSEEERWAYLLKMLKMVETIPPQNHVYDDLKAIVSNKPFHIITTNQDMLFKKFFPANHVSEIQGSWGYFQSANTESDKKLYPIDPFLDRLLPKIKNNRLPRELFPQSSVDGSPLVPWVRSREFLEDQKYFEEYDKANRFLGQHKAERLLFMEIGVGRMTPMFIQEPFWGMVHYLPQAFYVNFNPKDALVHPSIKNRSLLIAGDTAKAMHQLAQQVKGGNNE